MNYFALVKRDFSPPKKVPSVLLVDDETDVLFLTRKMLSLKGSFEIREARSPKEAYELLKKTQFDLVICDFFMKDGTGIDVFNYLELLGNRSTAFVLYSGSVESVPPRFLERVSAVSKWDTQGLVDKISSLGLL
jgi:CheY-like chemotaxis protein